MPELCPHLAPRHPGVGLHMEVSQVRAQLGHAPSPGDRRPQAQRQPGLRRRRGPAHERRKARRAALRAAAAEQAAAYESVAEEVAKSVTEKVAKSITEEVIDTNSPEDEHCRHPPPPQ